jgi:GNAT superfamily N-acetyltransferase
MESEKGEEMKIVDYFTAENKPHWQAQIQKSDWSAGAFLHDLLKEEKLKSLAGEQTKLFLLTKGDELISFCTLAEKDDIPNTELTPWVGFVYTFPRYRNRGYMGLLLDYAQQQAVVQGSGALYISTNHVGLYEKYGYNFLCEFVTSI